MVAQRRETNSRREFLSRSSDANVRGSTDRVDIVREDPSPFDEAARNSRRQNPEGRVFQSQDQPLRRDAIRPRDSNYASARDYTEFARDWTSERTYDRFSQPRLPSYRTIRDYTRDEQPEDPGEEPLQRRKQHVPILGEANFQLVHEERRVQPRTSNPPSEPRQYAYKKPPKVDSDQARSKAEPRGVRELSWDFDHEKKRKLIDTLKSSRSRPDTDIRANLHSDVVSDLENFIYLVRLGVSDEADSMLRNVLWHHLTIFPILAEAVAFAIEGGRYQLIEELIRNPQITNKEFDIMEREFLNLIRQLIPRKFSVDMGWAEKWLNYATGLLDGQPIDYDDPTQLQIVEMLCLANVNASHDTDQEVKNLYVNFMSGHMQCLLKHELHWEAAQICVLVFRSDEKSARASNVTIRIVQRFLEILGIKQVNQFIMSDESDPGAYDDRLFSALHVYTTILRYPARELVSRRELESLVGGILGILFGRLPNSKIRGKFARFGSKATAVRSLPVKTAHTTIDDGVTRHEDLSTRRPRKSELESRPDEDDRDDKSSYTRISPVLRRFGSIPEYDYDQYSEFITHFPELIEEVPNDLIQQAFDQLRKGASQEAKQSAVAAIVLSRFKHESGSSRSKRHLEKDLRAVMSYVRSPDGRQACENAWEMIQARARHPS